MANWHEIYGEIKASSDGYDRVRHKYLEKFRELRGGRNVILYYSGWLHRPHNSLNTDIDDRDKVAFMTLSHPGDIDHSKGLDLILHTPGGDAAAAESIIDFLRNLYGPRPADAHHNVTMDISAFVPQLAMSAGTMMACGCNEIYMGTHSSLGPIDPQLNGVAAWDLIDEFEHIKEDIINDKRTLLAWAPILSQYSPGLIEEFKRAIGFSIDVLRRWLSTGMFSDIDDDKEKSAIIGKIVKELSDREITKIHGRHLSIKQCEGMGLKIRPLALEENYEVKNVLLQIHSACDHTLRDNRIGKLIENHEGRNVILDAELRQPTASPNFMFNVEALMRSEPEDIVNKLQSLL